MELLLLWEDLMKLSTHVGGHVEIGTLVLFCIHMLSMGCSGHVSHSSRKLQKM
jgi:hypothetical protein